MDTRAMPEELRAQIWRRWKHGESLSEIGRALGKRPSTIFLFLRRQGGFAPRPRVRDVRSLHLHEREEISRGIASGATMREIARALRACPLEHQSGIAPQWWPRGLPGVPGRAGCLASCTASQALSVGLQHTAARAGAAEAAAALVTRADQRLACQLFCRR